MSDITRLLHNNSDWSQRLKDEQPDYFLTLAKQQSPEYLWIGCSDSRVPANEIVDLLPGELFVHRNVANLVYSSDLNCLSVIEYAVAVLKIKHIIVCGHYGCGGVRAALECSSHGLIDNWLTKIRDTYSAHREMIDALTSEEDRVDRVCELSVIEQVKSVTYTTIVQEAWARGQELSIHGWVYSLKNGLIKDLKVSVNGINQVAAPYQVITQSVAHSRKDA
ncbi:MAG: carbonate dehydratase [Chthoniobacterales bacterium]